MMRQIRWPILLACMAATLAFSQAAPKNSLDVPVNENTIVRFFYLPPYSYFHVPLSFRVEGENSSLLGTSPLANPQDRTPYISLSEMRNLIAGLAHLDLSWRQESKKLETPKKIETHEMTDKMEITVFSTGGTYRAFVDPKQLCERLAPLDAALKQPRALWEFLLFRVDYGCHVQGFDRNAFPEHDDPKAATQR